MEYLSIDGSATEMFVLFHGTGGNEYSLLQIVGDFNPPASICSFLGNVGVGVQRRFFLPLLNKQLQRADFENRVNDFLAQWEEIKPQTTTRLTFLGYSNGANFILGLLEKKPTIAERIVLMHPSNLDYTFPKGSNSEITITTGASDTMSVPGDVMKLAKQLETLFPNATLKLLDSEHNVTEQEITFLQERLK